MSGADQDVQNGSKHEEFAALFACACLMHGNWPKAAVVDVAFLPGLAVDNWQQDAVDDGILTTAAALYFEHGVRAIAIPGNAGTRPQGVVGPLSETGYPGGAVWKGELRRIGIPEEAIVFYATEAVGADGRSWNTRTEIDDFLRVARAKGWRRGVVLANPFHLLRVMLTLVRAMRDAEYEMRLDPVTPRAISWAKAVYHSQGLQRLPRHQHIAEEWARIPRYQENGSICSFAGLRDYLVRRLDTP